MRLRTSRCWRQPRLALHSFSFCISKQNGLEQIGQSSLITPLASITNMQNNSHSQPPAKPKNGIFDNEKDLKLYYKYYKEKNKNTEFIPIVFQHYYGKKNNKGMHLFFTKPDIPLKNVFEFLRRKAIAKQKELDRSCHDNESIYVFYKMSKKIISYSNNELVNTKYEQMKDEEGLLWLSYYFAYEQCYCPSGYEIAAILLLVPIALPIIATSAVYSWTTKKLSNISLPSIHIPSIHLPNFKSKTHSFQYKAKFSFEERRSKYQAFQVDNANLIAIIVERHRLSSLPGLPFFKFMVQPTITYHHFCSMMQTRILKDMGSEGKESKHSIFFVIGSQIPSHQVLMEAVYKKYRDEDGMLYVTYQEQESF